MPYFFTSESVSEGHPDKVADQISDALLDEFIRKDPDAKVACETFVTTGLVVVGGEVSTDAWIDVRKIVRDVIRRIGYTKSHYMFEADSCGIISTIHEQSPDIKRGVVRNGIESLGAGDQGIMFGYAVREADNFMPYGSELAHFLLQELSALRKEGKQMSYLGPDSKSQVTILYDDDNKPIKVDTVLISTQHDEFIKPKSNTTEAFLQAEADMLQIIKSDIQNILIPRLREKLPEKQQRFFNKDFKLIVNPTGKFVIGGPHGDTGLTGRKIIVDTYGGYAPHGGGAFSGKDPSKVDRSAAYFMRYLAKNMVAAGVADKVLLQISYAIGISEPISLYVNTYGTSKAYSLGGRKLTDGEIAEKLSKMFDFRPGMIIKKFGLQNPIYLPTAAYGHFGRDPYKEIVSVYRNGQMIEKEVEFFGWEKLDIVQELKSAFNL